MPSDGTVREIRQLHRPPIVMHVLRMYGDTGKVCVLHCLYTVYPPSVKVPCQQHDKSSLHFVYPLRSRGP